MEDTISRNRWTEDEFIVCLYYYFEISKKNGALAATNKRIIDIAKLLDRTPASISMRMLNYRYFDTNGNQGLSNGGNTCSKYYEKYKNTSKRDELNNRAEAIIQKLKKDALHLKTIDPATEASEVISNNDTLPADSLNNIVVELSVKMGKNLSGLFAILQRLNSLRDNSPIIVADLLNIANIIHELPQIDNVELEKTLANNIDLQQTDWIMKMWGIFNR